MEKDQEYWENKIDQITKDYTVSKYNLYKISQLKKIIELSYKLGNSCAVCRSNQKEFGKALELLPEVDVDIDIRNQYSSWFNLKREHFIKVHKYRSPNHFSAIYAIIFLVAFILMSIIVSKILLSIISTDIILMGSALGLIVGYVLGAMKDTKNRKAEMII